MVLKKKRFFCLLCLLYVLFLIINTNKTKEVSSISPDMKLIPSGQAVSMKLKTSGVLVVGVKSDQNLPAKAAGIKNGDIIKKVNGIDILNTNHFTDIILSSKGEPLTFSISRKDEDITAVLKPEKNQADQFICGMWLRDSAAGIGTITFITEDKKVFGALGHPVNDSDVDKIYDLRTGKIEKSEIKSVKIGEKNRPGELIGVLSPTVIGTISFNNKYGLYGKVNNEYNFTKNDIPAPLLPLNKVKQGPAKIISTVSENGKEEFSIEILKASDNKDNKDFVIKITDDRLLEKTGGIVQGMSGSPIIQDGYLIGAVTHVMLNDPKKGYGISIEKMLNQVISN